ncbi:MAG TPA: hypothetical protein VFQ61_14840 [Polyangiaceae bacterium]|nr:hypothetical protein [Polyangiaceae bacterium]
MSSLPARPRMRLLEKDAPQTPSDMSTGSTQSPQMAEHRAEPAKQGSEDSEGPTPRPRRAGARRTRKPQELPPIRGNLGEPVGVLNWERDFLLAHASAVLQDFMSLTEDDEEAG